MALSTRAFATSLLSSRIPSASCLVSKFNNTTFHPFGSLSMSLPSTYIIQAKKEHRATVIFLHGLGDQADGWAEYFERGLRHENVKYILPNAPSIPITRWNGELVPAWFDRLGMGLDVKEDVEGIEGTSKMIGKLIETELNEGISSENVILGGFSQGGAMALYTGLSHEKKLGGIIVLSSWLVLKERFPEKCSANRGINIFMGHGDSDEIVPLEWAQDSHKRISEFNSTIKMNVYKGMAHSSCPQEMREVKQFIQAVFEQSESD